MVDFSELNGMSVEEIDALVAKAKEIKKQKKEEQTALKAETTNATVALVNQLIMSKDIIQGKKIVITYGTEQTEIVAEVVGVNTCEKDSITCESDAFEGKPNDKGKKRRYIPKARFVRIATLSDLGLEG